jgi:hypothetical protein
VIGQQPFLQGYIPLLNIRLTKKFGVSSLDVNIAGAFVDSSNVDAVAPLAAKEIRSGSFVAANFDEHVRGVAWRGPAAPSFRLVRLFDRFPSAGSKPMFVEPWFAPRGEGGIIGSPLGWEAAATGAPRRRCDDRLTENTSLGLGAGSRQMRIGPPANLSIILLNQ